MWYYKPVYIDIFRQEVTAMKLNENGIIALISSAVLIVCGIIYLVSSDEPSDNRIIIKPRSTDTTQDISEEYSENKNDVTKENIVITTRRTNKSKKSTTTTNTSNVKTQRTSEITYNYPIDINNADKDMLCSVSGIGEVLAERILDYKSLNGNFKSMYELLEIDGIGEGKLDILMKYFYVTNDIGSQTKQSSYTKSKTIKTTKISTQSTSFSKTTGSSDYYGTSKTTDTKKTKQTTVTSSRKKVNINTADATEIQRSLLINYELAEKIVELREMIGGYSNIREVLMIDGFSYELLTELDEYIEI